MNAVRGSEPFYLGGYSFGASVAFEMSLQLQRDAAAQKPKALIMFDGSHNFVSQQIEMYKNKSEKDSQVDAIVAFTLQFNLSLDMKQVGLIQVLIFYLRSLGGNLIVSKLFLKGRN